MHIATVWNNANVYIEEMLLWSSPTNGHTNNSQALLSLLRALPLQHHYSLLKVSKV